MASGKQLSFAYGEVAPSLSYKSDEVSYAQGLAKLRNMYVRKSGGVSNRAGFEFVGLAISQEGIPLEGGEMGIKGFVYKSNVNDIWNLLEYAKTADSPVKYQIFLNSVSLNATNLISGPSPSLFKATPLREVLLITPTIEFDVTGDSNPYISYESAAISTDLGDTTSFSFPIGTTVTSGYNGLSPFLPVSYLITAVMEDGTEGEVYNVESAAIASPSTGPATVCHPHASLTAYVKVTLSSAMAGVKYFNLYRAAGRGGLASSFYSLAGKSRYNGTNLVLEFNDYGTNTSAVTPCLSVSSVRIGQFKGATSAAYYQQRLIMAMEQGTGEGGNEIPENFKVGDLLASKLGAVKQIIPPIIYADTGAFQFSVPITDGTKVVAQLAMERHIVFTEKGVYVIRGGEQGVLTPTQVNPTLMSQEGCSNTIEPKMSGRKGYFVNNSHTKLMAIEFGVDGNLSVFEATRFSDHMLYKDIVQVEVLSGGEDTVYLLRSDGKIVSVTNGEENSHGFSLIETDGHIESMYRGKAKRPYSENVLDPSNTDRYYDVLMCYIIRNGVRLLERLSIRDDRHREGEFYADCYYSFGFRLSDNGSNGYAKTGTTLNGATLSPIPTAKINIAAPLSGIWTAGESIDIWVDDTYLGFPDIDDAQQIHFYYEDEEGKQQTLRYFKEEYTETGIAEAPFFQKFSGYFDSDVPESLRDVKAQALTDYEKNRRFTRWLPTIRVSVNGSGLQDALFDLASPTPESAPVSVVADGEIISSPNNPNKNTLTLDKDEFGGVTIDLGENYAYGYIGLPYTSEFETLNLESSGNRTLTDSKKLLNAVGVALHETRGGFYGMQGKELTDMEEALYDEESNSFSVETQNFNGDQTIHIPAEWNGPGRVSIKQVDPAPITVLAVYPKGISGD
jgi:hypothetical protein